MEMLILHAATSLLLRPTVCAAAAIVEVDEEIGVMVMLSANQAYSAVINAAKKPVVAVGALDQDAMTTTNASATAAATHAAKKPAVAVGA